MLAKTPMYEDVGNCAPPMDADSFRDHINYVDLKEIEVEPPLLELAQIGDHRAFEKLIKPLIPKLKWRAVKAVGLNGADDVVQEACIKAFNKIGGFRGDCKFSSWFYVIGTNTIRMHLRSRRRREAKELKLLGEQSIDDVIGITENSYLLEDQLMGRESLRKALAGIEELPEGYRFPLWSQIMEGTDLASLGERMGLSPAAVKSRIHRARRALRELLAV
jgi:RNA polymerase sigma-70 factor, ECF subfamily